MKTATKEEKIDVSLLFLTQISYILTKREKLFEKFKFVIDQVTHPIIVSETPLLISRLILLLGYYIDVLYSKDQNLFLEVLQLLI